jgi:hypothetical protein
VTARRCPAPWRADKDHRRLRRPQRQRSGARVHQFPRQRSRSAGGQGADERRSTADRRQCRAAAGAARKGRARDVKMMNEVKKEPFETLRLRTLIASVRSRGLGYICGHRGFRFRPCVISRRARLRGGGSGVCHRRRQGPHRRPHRAARHGLWRRRVRFRRQP